MLLTTAPPFPQTKGETSIIGKVDAKSVCPSTVLATNVIESVQPSDYLRTVNERDCCCLFFYGLSRDCSFPLSFVPSASAKNGHPHPFLYISFAIIPEYRTYSYRSLNHS